MRYILSVICFFVMSVASQATDYYVCGTGSDAASGLTGAPWLTYDKGMTELSAMSGGDTLSFCLGFTETSTNSNTLTSSGTCTGASPCIVDSYDAGGSGVPQITNTTNDVLTLDGDILEDGGYTFNNIHFVGDNSVDCIAINDGFSNVTFASTVEFEGCEKGVDIEVVEDEVSTNIDIEATFTDITGTGIEGSASYSEWKVQMTGVGNTATTDHAIHLQGINTRSLTISTGKITNTAAVSTVCSSPIIYGNGSFKGLYIDHLHLKETEDTAASNCIGILLDGDFGAEAASFNYVSLYRPTFEYMGGIGFACNDCTNVTIDAPQFIGDDALTTGIKIPYSTDTADYVDIYKAKFVMRDSVAGRKAMDIDVVHGSIDRNHMILNDAVDLCYEANSSVTISNNVCMYATSSELEDSTNWTVN